MRVREHDIRPNEETGAPSLARLNRHDRRKRLRDNVLKRRWCRWRIAATRRLTSDAFASGRVRSTRGITYCATDAARGPGALITVGLTSSRPVRPGVPIALRPPTPHPCSSGAAEAGVASGSSLGAVCRPRRPEGNRGQPEAQQKADQEEEYTATSGPGRVLVRGARLQFEAVVARPGEIRIDRPLRACGTWRPHERQCQTDRAEGFTDVGPSGRSSYRATGAAASGRRAGEAPTGDGASHRKRAGFAGRPLRSRAALRPRTDS